ncbi:hypothetical protein HNW77_01860 [Komagataeibacter sp. AV436]|uniref:LysR family transcriptional regulator n=1 Tax=Komagataeibacter melomenusus TaxID=2766578 RepID=A0ABX2AA87_9PROT|nr:hypothetical protein [Komagataeibacter melomenusus]MBV1829439.1 hypothetical protein [Komagataeibacter melomenusus]NPC65170.1 hypothetical protein [Komagataeibacter melomenusus]
MFSSPEGRFNVLVCMHRSQPDTASTVLASLHRFIAGLAREQVRRHKRAPDAPACLARASGP